MQLQYFKSPFAVTTNKLHPNVLHLLALVTTTPTGCNGIPFISLVSSKLSDFPGNCFSAASFDPVKKPCHWLHYKFHFTVFFFF